MQHSSNNFGVDSLRASLKLNSGSMRFINHTYSHAYLGCVKDTSVQPWRCATDSSGAVKWVSANTISSEISRNNSWAAWNFVPIDSGELVTGEHSGLRSLPQMSVDNPNLASALNSNGIKWIASDASREKETRPIGRARTVPRYPMNIFYNAATTTQEVDEYNWIYTTRANGGSGLCEDNPTISTCIEPLDLRTGFSDYIVPLETRIAFGHVVDNDPRPHYLHQSNFTQDRIAYPVLDGVLSGYRSTFADSSPVVVPTLTEAGQQMQRQQSWTTQGINASTRPGGLLGILQVPFGDAYGGQRSAWENLGAGDQLKITLPASPFPASFDPATTAPTSVEKQLAATTRTRSAPEGTPATVVQLNEATDGLPALAAGAK